LSAAVVAVFWLDVPFGVLDWLGSACILATIFLLSQKTPAQDSADDHLETGR
jgi:drug/metabolite transporter (DMT)-like permease